MNLTRRSFVLFSLCASAQRLLGQTQGIATRDVKAQPKPAPSGRPFNARFTDVAKEAGLHAPIIYGGVESKRYIVEANGCGSHSYDYDNDGWMDILSLCEAPSMREIRQAKNQRTIFIKTIAMAHSLM